MTRRVFWQGVRRWAAREGATPIRSWASSPSCCGAPRRPWLEASLNAWARSLCGVCLVLTQGTASYFTPFFSTVVSDLDLQVRPGLSLWAGCALIIAGSFLGWKSIHPAP